MNSVELLKFEHFANPYIRKFSYFGKDTFSIVYPRSFLTKKILFQKKTYYSYSTDKWFIKISIKGTNSKAIYVLSMYMWYKKIIEKYIENCIENIIEN